MHLDATSVELNSLNGITCSYICVGLLTLVENIHIVYPWSPRITKLKLTAMMYTIKTVQLLSTVSYHRVNIIYSHQYVLN